MRIAFTPYILRGKSSFGNREGALLRFEFPDGEIGYADCHPWEEWGDLPLKQQLALLRKGIFTPLTGRSMILAQRDSEARAEEQNLFSGLTIPESHWLMGSSSDPIPEGFSRLKLKVGKRPTEEIPELNGLFHRLPEGVKVRLDFNARLSQEEFEAYLRAIDVGLDKIDFIEDPFPYERRAWEEVQGRHKLDLACDHLSDQRLDDTGSYRVVVLKTAVQSERPFRNVEGCRLVVTSYLDHPVGQLGAALVAAGLQTDYCGLLSHNVYQTNPFSERLQTRGAVLVPPEGTGIGFDTLLRDQPWKLL